MTRTLIALTLTTGLGLTALALSSRPAPAAAACEQLSTEAQRSGCCSWHHGVCGCSGGINVCCDGTSAGPTCTC
jgi:hypothetical protein